MEQLNLLGLEEVSSKELLSVNGGEFAPWERGGFYISMLGGPASHLAWCVGYMVGYYN